MNGIAPDGCTLLNTPPDMEREWTPLASPPMLPPTPRLPHHRAFCLPPAPTIVQPSIQAACTSIKIFDADGVQYELNSTRRLESLSTFLRSGSEAKLTMVLRSLEHVEKKCPRFVQLVALHSNQVTIRQTDHEASRLEDCLLIADDTHFARRNVQAHARGVVVRNDEREATPMIERFQQIIGASTVVSLATTLGL
jgi:hypothetical protein